MVLLTLTERHFGEPRGKAYPVALRHEAVLKVLHAGVVCRVLEGARVVSRTANSIEEVAEQGGGLVFLEYESAWVPFHQAKDATRSGIHHRIATLWVSLPDDVDPRCPGRVTVVEIGDEMEERAVPAHGPLLILGAQRSGTTALQVALHQATRYKSPRDVNNHDLNTLEGFLFAKTFSHFVTHRFVSPFGSDSKQFEFTTGMVEHSGQFVSILKELADSVRRCVGLLSGAEHTWTDKSPGWESSIMAGLFCGVYPNGRVIFLSRDPVDATLSMARMGGRLPQAIENQMLVMRDLARFAFNWALTHYFWRRYVRPTLPDGCVLEMSFETFRGQPEAAGRRIAEFLELTPSETERFLGSLPDVPVGKHAISDDMIDPQTRSILHHMCAYEAQHWPEYAHGLSMPDELDTNSKLRCSQAMTGHLQVMCERSRLTSDATTRVIQSLIDAGDNDQAVPSPGPLLEILLARRESD